MLIADFTEQSPELAKRMAVVEAAKRKLADTHREIQDSEWRAVEALSGILVRKSVVLSGGPARYPMRNGIPWPPDDLRGHKADQIMLEESPCIITHITPGGEPSDIFDGYGGLDARLSIRILDENLPRAHGLIYRVPMSLVKLEMIQPALES